MEKQTNQLNKVMKSITLIQSRLDNYDSNTTELKEKINNINYSEEFNKIMKQVEKMQKDIEEKQNMQEQIQLLLSDKMTQIQEEMEEQIQTEISKINYTEQINQINDMITNLKDSYLELSNKIRMNYDEKEEISNEKIIYMKSFKNKNKKKKKGIFSIEDNISYYELEKTATCVVPLEEKRESKSFLSIFQNAIW